MVRIVSVFLLSETVVVKMQYQDVDCAPPLQTATAESARYSEQAVRSKAPDLLDMFVLDSVPVAIAKRIVQSLSCTAIPPVCDFGDLQATPLGFIPCEKYYKSFHCAVVELFEGSRGNGDDVQDHNMQDGSSGDQLDGSKPLIACSRSYGYMSLGELLGPLRSHLKANPELRIPILAVPKTSCCSCNGNGKDDGGVTLPRLKSMAGLPADVLMELSVQATDNDDSGFHFKRVCVCVLYN